MHNDASSASVGASLVLRGIGATATSATAVWGPHEANAIKKVS